MIDLQRTFKLKGDKMEKPETYLGAQLDTMIIDGVKCWTMSAENYVKSAADNVETTLAKRGNGLPSKCHTPFSSNFKPELDMMAELKVNRVQYYQELIGILRWAAEIGGVDILLQTSLMSSYLALPRIGHPEQLYHSMFGYLKIYPKHKLVFDPTHPKIDERRFVKHDWTDFYRDVKEDIPSDMPPPRGKSVSTHAFGDADHAGNTVTRCLQTGILLFVNRAPRHYMVQQATEYCRDKYVRQ